MTVYKGWVQFLRWFVSTLTGWRSDQTPLSEPAVYVVHHQNLFGPFHVLAHCSTQLRPWILHVFCDRQACFEQYYTYTFTERFGWPKPLAFLVCEMISLFVPRLMKGLQAIPVYRESRRVRETIDASQEALRAGYSLLIAPDVDYASSEEETDRIYQGFLRLERHYYEETGKHLPFLPIYCDKEKKRIAYGNPIRFEDGRSFREQKQDVARRLIQEMNRFV